MAATLSFNNAMASMSDWLFSGKLVQFPDVKLAYSEGQIGWIPYILERADTVWEEHRAWGGVKDLVPEPPSTYYYRQMYGCFFRDQHGIDSLDKVGVDNITFETDYPHTDSTWPNTKAVATELMRGRRARRGREDHARQRPPHARPWTEPAQHGAARPRVDVRTDVVEAERAVQAERAGRVRRVHAEDRPLERRRRRASIGLQRPDEHGAGRRPARATRGGCRPS